ncbi:S1C family serine protease [Patescibacteria group bacterium]
MKNNNIFVSVLSGGITALVVSLIVMMGFGSLEADDVNKTIVDNSPETENEQVKVVREGMIQEDLVIETVENSKKAVVSIVVEKDVPVYEQYYEDYQDPFEGFFGPSPFNMQIPQYRENGTERKEIGGGSGFIVSEDGYVITNRHVVSDDTASYMVFFDDGEKVEAKVVARDSLNDIAILKIEGDEFPFLKFGDSDDLQLGQSVIAIGNPLMEFNNSVSLGIISGLSRSIVAGDGFGMSEYLDGVIQTDAAINPGNSGGPLLNLNGEVIGVNVAVASAENIGFSLPSNMVKNVVDSVREHGKIVRPFLGVRYMPITEELREINNLEVEYGVLILRGANPQELAVIPGSPADKAGLEENDIILEMDGEKLEDGRTFSRKIAEKNVGDTVKLKVLHDGEESEVDVVLEEMKE